MPIMTRMRDSMPVILFGLLIAFLITIVFEWGMDYLGLGGRSRADVIGRIDGKKISYKEFADLLRNVAESRRAQGQKESDEDESKQDRDQVWESIVNQTLITEQIERLGLKVTDQEIQDLVTGDNPPEDLRRYFVDSTGQFRRDVYDEFLRNPDQFIRDPQGNDPNYGTTWLIGYERNLRQRLLQEKLQSLLFATIRVTDGEVRQQFAQQSRKFDALYAFFDPNVLVKDADVPLTDADLKSYYEENIDQFKFEASRKLQYVMFLENPSPADSASRIKDMAEAAEKARSGNDFIDLVYTFSDKPDSGAFFGHGELAPDIENAVFRAKVGEVVGPIQDNDGLHLFKVLGERSSAKEYVHASHILFTLEGQPDSNAVKNTAAKVAQLAREGKDFGTLAREYSKDPGSATKGGDLGWFT
ncbi:MAG TPA: SurA N-terminal domain-containing protein, partial [Bacteroidota bacterium]|nr:SurA N-terminal domain-containing protein [Bacteroidota bacterium]